MKQTIAKITKKPWVAHILRAVARFGNRQGSQFAAAMTYFSIMAVVPITMIAFASLGLALSLEPSLMDAVKTEVGKRLGDSQSAKDLTNQIGDWMRNWPGVGLVGLLTALYAGAGWVSNLKNAIRAMWRPEFEQPHGKSNFFKELAINVVTLIGLLIVGGLCIAGAQASTWASGLALTAIGIANSPAGHVIAWLIGMLVSILFAFLMFLYMYRVLPEQHTKMRPWLWGSLVASIALALLLQAGGALMGIFAHNKAALLFGPLIVGMLAFNIFATMTLYVAAWIATFNQPAVARHWNDADAPLMGKSDTETAEGHWDDAVEDRARQEAEKRGESYETDEERADPNSPASIWVRQRRGEIGPQPGEKDVSDPNAPIDAKVAQKAVRAGMLGGYTVGAATGVGIGAIIVRIVSAIVNRRKR